MSDCNSPTRWYILADPRVIEQCLEEARRWVAESGRIYNTGSNTGFAVGAVAEYICNTRYNCTISMLRTPEGAPERSEN